MAYPGNREKIWLIIVKQTKEREHKNAPSFWGENWDHYKESIYFATYVYSK